METSARLFVALWPPAAIQQALGELGCTLSARVGGRAVAATNIHLTLAFLGEVTLSLQQRLEAALAGRLVGRSTGAQAKPPTSGHACSSGVPAPLESFALTLDQLGSFGSGIVWVGARSVPPALLALHAAIVEEVTNLGIPLEGRRFAAHLTLLRKARKPPRQALSEAMNWDVSACRLVASQLTPEGSRYWCIGEWPLQRPAIAD